LRLALGDRFEILSGDDSLTLSFMAVGAQGVISVASNIIPRQVSQMVAAFASGKSQAALNLHQKYYPLFKDLFIETNPIPVKAAMAMMGQIQEEYRLPLSPMNAQRHFDSSIGPQHSMQVISTTHFCRMVEGLYSREHGQKSITRFARLRRKERLRLQITACCRAMWLSRGQCPGGVFNGADQE